MIDWRTPFQEIEIGKGRLIQDGEDVAVLTIGHVGNFVQEVITEAQKEGVSVAHYDLRFVKPLDEQLLHEVGKKFKKVITVEDGCVQGGMGSAVLEFFADHNYAVQVKRLGIPDRYVEHGEQAELHAECGFDSKGILQTVLSMQSVSIVH